MRVGTKSVLYGAHCFLIHWIAVAISWARLYGFPWDFRLWVAFAVHDLGYWGRNDMDGVDGESHVLLGGRIMGFFFGESWQSFTVRHSRYWAKRMGLPVSRLCAADKLAFVLMPPWLYLPMTRATGELSEYMQRSAERQAGGEQFTPEESAMLSSPDPRIWLEGLQSYTRRWVHRHRDGGEDNWTVVEQKDVVALGQ
jgi:hypothetical protein